MVSSHVGGPSIRRAVADSHWPWTAAAYRPATQITSPSIPTKSHTLPLTGCVTNCVTTRPPETGRIGMQQDPRLA